MRRDASAPGKKTVISGLRDINRDTRDRILNQQREVIGRPRS
jgi:hypothetical protein